MNSLATPHQASARNWASHRTATDRDALGHLLDRHALQSRQLADAFFASPAARDPRLAGDRTRINLARARMERSSNAVALLGAVALVAMLSLLLHMPVVEQLARILAAGVVLTLFGLLTRPVRGLLGLVLPLHLAMCLALLGQGGWLEVDGAAGWDFALLALGAGAAAAVWLRDRKARALDLDEAELVMKAKGHEARLETVRRWADAAI